MKALQEQISRLKSGNTPSNNSQTSPGASSDTAGSTTFYTYNSHTSPVSCSWSGGTVANGSTVTAYQSPSVAAGSQCVSQQRTCTNGSLSGSYANPSCSVTTTASTTTSTGAASCSFNGQTVAHGSSVTAYQTSSVAFGSKCHLETRTCRNGTLTGSYGNRSCSVSGPLNAFRILVGLTQINSDEAAQAASFAADGAGIDVSVSTAINWTQTFSDMNAGSWATSGDAATCAQCAPGSWDDIANVTAASKALGRLVDGAVFYNEDFDNVATIPPLSDAQCPLVSNPNGDRMLDDRISKVKSLIAQREAIDAELASLLGVQPKKPRGRPPKIEAPTHQELEPGT